MGDLRLVGDPRIGARIKGIAQGRQIGVIIVASFSLQSGRKLWISGLDTPLFPRGNCVSDLRSCS